MANTLTVTGNTGVTWNYQKVDTIGNSGNKNGVASSNTFLSTVATGLLGDLIYATKVAITSSTQTWNPNSFADFFGDTKNFLKMRLIHAKCTAGAGTVTIGYNASGLAGALVSSLVSGTTNFVKPLTSGQVWHEECATTAGFPVHASDTVVFTWVSGTFTVEFVAVGSVA